MGRLSFSMIDYGHKNHLDCLKAVKRRRMRMNKNSRAVNFATVLLYAASVFLIVDGDFWIGMGFFATATTILSALMYNKKNEATEENL